MPYDYTGYFLPPSPGLDDFEEDFEEVKERKKREFDQEGDALFSFAGGSKRWAASDDARNAKKQAIEARLANRSDSNSFVSSLFLEPSQASSAAPQQPPLDPSDFRQFLPKHHLNDIEDMEKEIREFFQELYQFNLDYKDWYDRFKNRMHPEEFEVEVRRWERQKNTLVHKDQVLAKLRDEKLNKIKENLDEEQRKKIDKHFERIMKREAKRIRRDQHNVPDEEGDDDDDEETAKYKEQNMEIIAEALMANGFYDPEYEREMRYIRYILDHKLILMPALQKLDIIPTLKEDDPDPVRSRKAAAPRSDRQTRQSKDPFDTLMGPSTSAGASTRPPTGTSRKSLKRSRNDDDNDDNDFHDYDAGFPDSDMAGDTDFKSEDKAQIPLSDPSVPPGFLDLNGLSNSEAILKVLKPSQPYVFTSPPKIGLNDKKRPAKELYENYRAFFVEQIVKLLSKYEAQFQEGLNAGGGNHVFGIEATFWRELDTRLRTLGYESKDLWKDPEFGQISKLCWPVMFYYLITDILTPFLHFPSRLPPQNEEEAYIIRTIIGKINLDYFTFPDKGFWNHVKKETVRMKQWFSDVANGISSDSDPSKESKPMEHCPIWVINDAVFLVTGETLRQQPQKENTFMSYMTKRLPGFKRPFFLDLFLSRSDALWRRVGEVLGEEHGYKEENASVLEKVENDGFVNIFQHKFFRTATRDDPRRDAHSLMTFFDKAPDLNERYKILLHQHALKQLLSLPLELYRFHTPEERGIQDMPFNPQRKWGALIKLLRLYINMEWKKDEWRLKNLKVD